MFKHTGNRFTALTTGAAMATLLLLSGCSQTVVGTANRNFQADNENAMDALFRVQLPMKPDPSSISDESDGIWTTSHAVRQDHGDTIPSRWEVSGITFQDNSTPLTLRQIATKITAGTGIPIYFNPDISSAIFGAGGKPGGSRSGSASHKAGSDAEQALGDLGVSAAGGAPDESNTDIHETFGDAQRVLVRFHSGPISKLMTEVTSPFGLTWRYSRQNGGYFEISRNVVRTYYINALPLSALKMEGDLTQVLNSAASGSGGQQTSSSSGSTNLKTTESFDVSIWQELTDGVQGILAMSGDEGKVMAEKSTSTMTVAAPPQTMDRVQRYIERQNEILSKTVSLHVDVISIQLKTSDSVALKLNGLLNKANRFALDYGTGGTSELVAAADAGQALLGKISGDGSSSGTEFLVQQLSSIGNVSVDNQGDASTLSGMPVPLQIAQTIGYLAEVQTMVTSTSSASASNSQTTMTPGSVVVGLNLRMLPQVLPDNRRVRLHLTASLSDLHGTDNGFDKYSTGNQTIQLPNIISRNIQQDMTIPNGRTYYVSGVSQTSITVNKEGTGTGSMLALGGSQSGIKLRTMFIVAITPAILTQDVISFQDGM